MSCLLATLLMGTAGAVGSGAGAAALTAGTPAMAALPMGQPVLAAETVSSPALTTYPREAPAPAPGQTPGRTPGPSAFLSPKSPAAPGSPLPACPETGLRRISGDRQVLFEGGVSEPVVVHLTDASGTPIVGERLHLLVGHCPAKAAAVGFDPPALVTDAQGQASFSIGVSVPGEYVVIVQRTADPTQIVKVELTVYDSSWLMFLLFGLAGGLGMFLYGMTLGAEGLQKIAGRRMKAILGAFTSSTWLGILTGVVVTAITQSSSATTVMLVGFVNASLMTLPQTLSVIMGANIGTTFTVQLIAFDISHWALLLIGVGFALKQSSNRTTSYAGDITLGFGLIFYGMKVMSTAMSPLRSFPAFKELLISISHYPITAILGSMLFTSLIQSSGATIGLIVVFAGQGLISLDSAIPLILGAHIGTCITGWIAALGASLPAKKTALLNVVYNMLGTVIFLPFLYDWASFADLVAWCSAPFGATPAREVANAHMLSATLKVVALLPFYDRIIALTEWLLPEPGKPEEQPLRTKFLSEELLRTPELALGNVAREIARMAGHVEVMMHGVPALISYAHDAHIEDLTLREQKVDFLRLQITRYLSRLSENTLTAEQTATMMQYMNVINDLEGLADMIYKVILPCSKVKKAGELRFSEEGFRELMKMFDAVNAVFLKAINGFATHDLHLIEQVLASEPVIAQMEEELRASHMKRVFAHRDQSVQTSTLHLDLLSTLKNIHSQAVKIARALAPHDPAPSAAVASPSS
ncbi:MAG: Sodium-dependent phosphate transporter [Candidatus Ozemobacter sibiricus]|uniref:Sodium-dependent phosphate transporter n=1 Tax=Candidatus Ozemobacter sibiricus TaxID=2268124 RepID=A0A367ZT08_9BACT|nr:MAG: Sodium-dependent phosphate transporter [Candidatus Ozemobacter sibiricus]